MATARKNESQRSRAELLKIIAVQNKEIQNILEDFIQLALVAGASNEEIRQRAKLLADRIGTMLESSIVSASGLGLSYMSQLGNNYLDKVEKATKAAAQWRPMITAEWGGGLEERVLNLIWNKVWDDGKTLNDRIYRIGASTAQKTEQVVKAGIKEGLSSRDIAKKLNKELGLEKKAAFRLAVHSTNTAYNEATAEISMQMPFIMGVRIIRGMYGNASDNCHICEEHGGPADGSGKEYRKSDFGGRDIDMWIMTNSPEYHPNCNCGVEYIEMSASEFVKYARLKYGGGGGED